eukprot:3961397-Pleurochrysis_carterae.AAC.1
MALSEWICQKLAAAAARTPSLASDSSLHTAPSAAAASASPATASASSDAHPRRVLRATTQQKSKQRSRSKHTSKEAPRVTVRARRAQQGPRTKRPGPKDGNKRRP